MGYSLLMMFLRFLLLYTSINGDSIQEPACPSFDCGNGIIIGYPFWHQNQQLEHCGYPGFNLSCNDQNPMLRLSDDYLYPIKDINYSNKSLTLFAYPSLNSAPCPKITHDIALNTTPHPLFNSLGNKVVHFFYNCTLYPPSLPHIRCLEYGAKRSFVFKEGAIPEFDWDRYCASIVALPVIDEAVDHGDLVKGLGKVLQKGFKLTWNQAADEVCQSCEASGGFCSYRKGQPKNFFCICSNGRQSFNCHGIVSIQEEPNYVGIGALLLGGMVIMATVFYFIQKKKKKFGLYKPV
ncbi:hypothetical protein P3X46_005857 [Hevea brasiliensis]|uniref:non-specific serine/threonine protein kinase n=1 Tax=Hevea brasiliensis TaxID=3981 RepID=A0ABQ9MPC5_HEVBR|nr:hypothetical protein P3X46_005857 [Hevea brasiliensis]